VMAHVTYLSMAMQTSRTSRLLLVAFHFLLSADQTASFASSVLGSFPHGLAIGADDRSRCGRCRGADTRWAAPDRRKRCLSRRRMGGTGGLTPPAQLLKVRDHALRVRVLQWRWALWNITGGSSCSGRGDRGMVGD